MSVLDNEAIRDALRVAWLDSNPGSSAARGFILRDAQGELSVERWPRGEQNEIRVPPHPGGKRGAQIVVASFHTHPNSGADFQQEPSLTDIRAVRLDPDLGHVEYEGELVIASELVYRIRRSGNVEIVGKTESTLKT